MGCIQIEIYKINKSVNNVKLVFVNGALQNPIALSVWMNISLRMEYASQFKKRNAIKEISLIRIRINVCNV